MSKDYYEILSVSRTATQEDIKQAYRKLALKYHPDRNAGDKAKEAKFKEASEAYQVLKDPKTREQYDRFGHDAFRRGGGGAHFQDLGDIFSTFRDIFEDSSFGGSFFGHGFEDLFSGGTGSSSRFQKGHSLRYVLELSLKEVLTGVDKDIAFEGHTTCSSCKGSGAKPGTTRTQCSYCQGQGQKVSRKGFFTFSAPCTHCRGEGSVLEKPCGECYGIGKVKKKRKLTVKIPAGVDHGTQLRMKGEGEPGLQGGESGDLFIEVLLKEDKHFVKRNQDLKTPVSITYLQALLGAQVPVKTLTETETLEIPAGSQSGDQIVLSHRGLPSLKNPTRGDLICEIQVKIPKKLNKKEEKLLREIADLKKESVSSKKNKLF